jgi:hypothetical protein
VDDFNARDLFAGLAMCGQLANSKIDTDASYADIAICSYEIADAMLKEKEKRDERVKDEN